MIDRSTRTYKTEWLPDTTLPSVRMFFVQLNCGELSNTRVGASVTKNDNQSDVLPEHYRQNTTAGQVWFNLCSALPLCDYLSRTDTGVQYELTPTRVNVCKVLSIFLTGKSDTFHNFQTLSFYWNQHRLSQATLCGEDLSGAPLTATDEVASFRAPFSDTEMIQRETGRLSYAHSNCALLVEIEKAHGLSSVRHLRADVSKLVWQQSVVKGRILRHWQSILATSGVNKKDNCQLSIPQLIMISATLGDDMLYSAHDHCQSVLSKKLYSDETLRNIMCLTTAAVLAMPVGEERLSYVYRITQVPSSTSGTATGGAVDESAGGGGVMSSVAAERKREYDKSVYALIDKLLHSLMTTAATRSSYMTEVVDMKILIQWLHSQVSELLQSSTSASTTSLVSSYMTLVWSKYRFAAITITTVSVVAAFVLIPYVWHIHD